MKKLLIAALVIVIGGVGIIWYMQCQKPENQIVGQWKGSYEIGSFDFKKDGAVTVGFVGLSADGEYEIDSDNSVISITYTLLGISYTKKYDFVLEKNKLTLTDHTFSNIKLYYSREEK
ncbi:MAG: hypothetical protein GX107_06825 [Clostridiales bacterium]|nr:hypothetical protein [Clostridiales bacterium]